VALNLGQGNGSGPLTGQFQLNADPSGHDMIVGIRPEHMRLIGPEAAAEAGSFRIEAQLNHLERVGARCILHLTCGDKNLIVIERNGFQAQSGDRLTVAFDAADCAVFDQAHGTLIGGGKA